MSGSLSDAEREASRWIARLEASDVTLDDHQRFRQWLSASEENKAAYEALSRTFDQLDILRFREKPAQSLSTAPSRRWVLLGGAGAAIAAGAVGALWLVRPTDSFAATYETPVGGRYSTRLVDGSHIELNAASGIRVSFDASRRTIEVNRGEALLDLAHDRRSFEVKTHFGSITGNSASLLIKASQAFVRATLLSGEVAVNGASVSAPHEFRLGANLIASPTPITSQDAERRLAWRDNRLSFDGETLSEAASDVERQTGQHFVFADANVANLRVGGVIEARNSDAFVTLLESNLGLTVQRADSAFLVSQRNN